MQNAPLAGGALRTTEAVVSPETIPPATDNDREPRGYQVMPPLSGDEYAALRADIADRGILVAVVLDQHGNTLDGHHRQRIAAELGIDCPTVIQPVSDEGEGRDVALTLNLARRHLTSEQKRALIAAELERDPDAADRSIARRLHRSPSTVGAVRRGQCPSWTPGTRHRV